DRAASSAHAGRADAGIRGQRAGDVRRARAGRGRGAPRRRAEGGEAAGVGAGGERRGAARRSGRRSAGGLVLARLRDPDAGVRAVVRPGADLRPAAAPDDGLRAVGSRGRDRGGGAAHLAAGEVMTIAWSWSRSELPALVSLTLTLTGCADFGALSRCY